MKQIKNVYLFVVILMILMGMLSGCSEKEKKVELPQYPGWKSYSYKHFVYHYPEDSYWGKNIDQFSSGYEKFLKEDCEFLAMELPTDAIHFYIHNNPEEGLKLTGQALPFHTEKQIHWDRRSAWGLELARFLIDRMDVRMTDFRFLRDGLATLLDYSGADYHHNMMSLIEIKQYIPLDSLINNESYLRADNTYREWEAASFVAFATYNFGINRFKILWQSASSFEESIKQIFGVDMAKFETGWHIFAKPFYQGIKIDGEMPDSTSNK
jgi:hypothetical protein